MNIAGAEEGDQASTQPQVLGIPHASPEWPCCSHDKKGARGQKVASRMPSPLSLQDRASQCPPGQDGGGDRILKEHPQRDYFDQRE